MNKREAKRQAYLRARGVILAALEGSDEWLTDMYDESDAEKVESELMELADELSRKAGP